MQLFSGSSSSAVPAAVPLADVASGSSAARVDDMTEPTAKRRTVKEEGTFLGTKNRQQIVHGLGNFRDCHGLGLKTYSVSSGTSEIV